MPGRHLAQRRIIGAAPPEKVIRAVERGLLRGGSFTRADPATRFDSSGLLQTASANEARTTYIDGVPYLWSDGAVTEISGRSADLDNWTTAQTATVTKDAVGLDGEANSGWTLTDNSNTVTQSNQQNLGITASTNTYYLLFALKKDASPAVYPRVDLEAAGGGTSVRQHMVPDPSDGSYVLQLSEGAVVLAPVLIGDHWLSVLSVTDTNDGNTAAVMRIVPAANTDGSTSEVAATQGSTGFGYCGLFKDNFSLMPILTTGGTTKTVAADVASLANSVISGLTEGTLYMEIWTPQLTSNAARHIAELESDANNFIRVLHAADGDLDAQITDGGASQAALAGTDLTVGQLQKVALAFDGNDFALYRDGTQEATDSGGTVPSVDTLLIGAGLYGGIKTMNLYTSRLPNSQLVALTT